MKEKISIQIIDKSREKDINLANQSFQLFGRMIPNYQNESWGHEIAYFDQVTEMCFPNEAYDYDMLVKDSTFIGAYMGETCVGLAIVQEGFFKYLYLYDLKVNQDYRRTHVSKLLMDKIKEVAKSKGYIGVYTQGQDNNLGACLYYLKNDFVIGGLDTQVYHGTPQEDKKDILFYYTE